MEQLLTIGEFAGRCGLSRSALRFYDQNDLLRPWLVDGDSGYRYYAVEQIAQAALVRRLRAADLPVGMVRRYLAASVEERRVVLDEHLASFRERAAEVEKAVAGLRGELGGRREGEVRLCQVIAAEFAEAVGQVSFAIADPAERVELGAVWVETRDGSLRLVATDSYRLAVRDLVPGRIQDEGLRGVIEAGHLTWLRDAAAGMDTLTLSQTRDGLLTATVDGRDVTVGHSGTEFPDYERILTEMPTGDVAALAREEIRRGLFELEPGAAHVCLDFDAGRLQLQAGGQTVAVACEWSGSPLRVFLDVRFLTEAVEATLGPDLIIEAIDPLQPIALRSADTGTFTVLTMPVRPPSGE